MSLCSSSDKEQRAGEADCPSSDRGQEASHYSSPHNTGSITKACSSYQPSKTLQGKAAKASCSPTAAFAQATLSHEVQILQDASCNEDPDSPSYHTPQSHFSD